MQFQFHLYVKDYAKTISCFSPSEGQLLQIWMGHECKFHTLLATVSTINPIYIKKKKKIKKE